MSEHDEFGNVPGQEEGNLPGQQGRQDGGHFGLSLQAMQNQINLLTSWLTQQQMGPGFGLRANQDFQDLESSAGDSPELNCLSVARGRTEVNENKVLESSSAEELAWLMEAQRFGTEAWKEVRYSNALKVFSATPGFVKLKINSKLCHLDKGKDELVSTDRVLAGMSRALYLHRDLMVKSCQGILEWALESTEELNPGSLFEKLNQLLADDFELIKGLDQTLQVSCGKRAEIIESRRERLIAGVTSKNVRSALREIPPSSEYLFEKERLTSLIQALGGSKIWLEPPRLTSRFPQARTESRKFDPKFTDRKRNTQFTGRATGSVRKSGDNRHHPYKAGQKKEFNRQRTGVDYLELQRFAGGQLEKFVDV